MSSTAHLKQTIENIKRNNRELGHHVVELYQQLDRYKQMNFVDRLKFLLTNKASI